MVNVLVGGWYARSKWATVYEDLLGPDLSRPDRRRPGERQQDEGDVDESVVGGFHLENVLPRSSSGMDASPERTVARSRGVPSLSRRAGLAGQRRLAGNGAARVLFGVGQVNGARLHYARAA